MVRIGLLSDTHGHWDKRYEEYFAPCDEIWHAGDIGSEEVYTQLCKLKPTRAVAGNIDGGALRMQLKRVLRFKIEEVEVLLTHIGGYPGRYDAGIRDELTAHPPKLFICGHSHILKVMPDHRLGLLHINPGAAGLYGFHQVRTLIRFTIDKDNIVDLEVIELHAPSIE